MHKPIFSGSIPALITPFLPSQAIDYAALEALIEWHIEEESDGLVIAGSTGEGALLSYDEWSALIAFAVKCSAGRIPIIASCGKSDTRSSFQLAQKAQELGVDAALVVVPYYVRPSEEGCFAHFAKLAELELPLILYHHPGRTGIKLSIECMERLCSLSEIVAIKEASADLGYLTQLQTKISIPILSGDDHLFLPQLTLGCPGSISVIANLIPGSWKQLIRSFTSGDLPSARTLFFKLYPLIQALGLETNPQPVKYALAQLGRSTSIYRLPLVLPSEKTRAAIDQALMQISDPIAESVLQ